MSLAGGGHQSKATTGVIYASTNAVMFILTYAAWSFIILGIHRAFQSQDKSQESINL
jgi:hypothetical protein